MSSFKSIITKDKVEIIQINLGNLCNQQCDHCHVSASPMGKDNMKLDTVVKIINKLKEIDVKKIEFTGGAPEMNEFLPKFIQELGAAGKDLTVRTNLTILSDEDFCFYFNLYKEFKVHLVASLPCYCEENVDTQRGLGVYEKSIKVLKKLNDFGYGTEDLQIDLVYNPLGDFLPGNQSELELSYKENLRSNYGIEFNRLITIANIPINRFKEKLVKENKYENYIQLLKDNYNEKNISKLMCKKLISVNYEGYVYDCDFNQVLGLKTTDRKLWDILPSDFNSGIITGDHCFGCTAGAGSSCFGQLA